ncbi:hypothetical protein [uncultured Helicobacter sp.]|uniref:hypothetical protein n=1 Tax=uncultured Helicobacter sp. TaxID=175537 RepID=UPI002627EAB0|nr:hypothetical protein [uncultured Helicobacter sp.]
MKKKQKREECKAWLKGDRDNNLNYVRELLEGIHYIGMRKDFYGKHACLSSLIVRVVTCIDELVPEKNESSAIHHHERGSIGFEEIVRQNLCKKDGRSTKGNQ